MAGTLETALIRSDDDIINATFDTYKSLKTSPTPDEVARVIQTSTADHTKSMIRLLETTGKSTHLSQLSRQIDNPAIADVVTAYTTWKSAEKSASAKPPLEDILNAASPSKKLQQYKGFEAAAPLTLENLAKHTQPPKPTVDRVTSWLERHQNQGQERNSPTR